MPTGLKNSVPLLPASQLQPRGSINETIQIVFAATGVPQQLPSLLVPAGVIPSLRGVNGSAINANPVFAGSRPGDVSSPSSRQTISPDTEIAFPADNLNQIWIQGTAADGVLVTVRSGAVG